MKHTITITPAQAQYIAADLEVLAAAQAKASERISFACAGHVPEGAVFVSVNRETGELIMQTPD